MKRREMLMSMAAVTLGAGVAAGKNKSIRNNSLTKLVRPKHLTEGDKVRLIAPAGPVSADLIERAIANITSLGLKPEIAAHARSVNRYLAGTDKERVDDLNAAFADKSVSAVWCIRGGYGTPRILPLIDYQLIKSNPKILIGFSDITALLQAVHKQTSLVTFHGPGGSSNFSDYTREHLKATLFSTSTGHKVQIVNNAVSAEELKKRVIKGGKARGQLVGGNLALLSAIAGTPYSLEPLDGKILMIEDTNEPPYKVDRMLTQLRQSVSFKGVKGIGIGTFSANDQNSLDLVQPLIDVFKDVFADLNVPIVYGLTFGHITDQFTFPIGVEAEIDADRSELTFLSSCVK